MMKKYIGYGLIVISIIIIIVVGYLNSNFSNQTRAFSPYTLLTSSWDAYKSQYMNSDGRVIDYSQNGITTSEGQSYALLRAVWIDDKPSFDTVWHWTITDMKRPNDNLFAWRWGKRANGTYGPLDNGGSNSASDADTDIACALVLASHRWGDASYMDSAKKIIPDIWRYETVIANGKRYVTAGNWAVNGNEVVLDPSYFAPYAYRVFAQVDTKDDWLSIIDPGYQLLMDLGTAPLNTGNPVGLPPDWVTIQRDNGTLKVASVPNATTNYSFDAMRVPFRIALDYFWNHDDRAKEYLTTSYAFLLTYYKTNGMLAGSYTHDGKVFLQSENPVMYATSIGYFMIADPAVAKEIYQDKIIKLYSNDNNSFNSSLGYYEQNWLWFGAAMYNNYLHNY